MALSSLKLFFARMGGRDIPLAYNWFEKFGFDSTYDPSTGKFVYDNGPIYKHSLMDVLNNFDSPINFNTKDIIGLYKSVSDLTIVETSDNTDAKSIIITTTFWRKVLTLLELIYENQSEWRGYPINTSTDDTPYSSRGDEILRTDPQFSDVAKIYKKGTLVNVLSSSSTLNTRILSCTFTVTPAGLTVDERNEDAGTVADSVRITAYFNPDTYITTGANNNYAVYSYEDLTNDLLIDDTQLNQWDDTSSSMMTEFDAAIVKKINEITKTGKFKRYVRFCPTGGTDGATFYINKGVYGTKDGQSVLFTDETQTEIINSLNMADYGYNKPFYIFTSLDESQELDNTTILGYIRNYIETNMYPGTEAAQIVERTLRFPNLFSETIVSIYPVITNFEPNSSSKLKFPLDGRTLKTYLDEASITDTQYEIFYVGRSSYGAGNKEYAEIPLIATEHASTSTSGNPITSRFPTFRPINSSNDDNSDIDARTIVFHDLCILALSILMGNKEVSDIEVGSSITVNGIEYDLVTGMTNFTEIEAGYSEVDGIAIKHSVQFSYNNIKYKFIDAGV